MKMQPLSANKIMIIAGCALVFLMVVNAGLSTMKRRHLNNECHGGDLKACTILIATPMPEKDRGKYFVMRGYYLDQKGEYDLALADYTNAISRVPPQPALYANRASTYVKKGKFNEAILDYSAAINLVPSHTAPDLYCARADAEYHKGDTAHGDADLAQAGQIAPQAACIEKVRHPAPATPPMAPIPAPTPAAGTPHPAP